MMGISRSFGWGRIIPASASKRNPALLAALLLLALAACARPEPERIIETQIVKVPVPVTCVPKGFARAPTYSDTDAAVLATAGVDELLIVLIEGRLQRVVRTDRLETVVEGCR
jgi:hypothetical protein